MAHKFYDDVELRGRVSEGTGSYAVGTNAHAEGTSTEAYGESSHTEGNSTIAGSEDDETKGCCAHAEGTNTIATGDSAHAEGEETQAQGDSSHAEGLKAKAISSYSHAEGYNTQAKGEASHAEGHTTETRGNYSHTEGYYTITGGNYSHAEGRYCGAIGEGSHAEGYSEGSIEKAENMNQDHILGLWGIDDSWFVAALGIGAHAEGYSCLAEGDGSHAEGFRTHAQGNYSHATGGETKAIGIYSYAGGYGSTAKGAFSYSHGSFCETESDYSVAFGSTKIGSNSKYSCGIGGVISINGYCSYAFGSNLTIEKDYQFVIGKFNKNNGQIDTDNPTVDTKKGTAFIIGNGTSISGHKTYSNAFRVDYDGSVYGTDYGTMGADYAEYFEWDDNNLNKEDRRGYFVTLQNNKIKIASSTDYILGIISVTPSVSGNNPHEWSKRYIRDKFGSIIIDEIVYEETVLDDKTNEEKIITKTALCYKENPDYDPTKPYIERDKRPEWAAVGMLGVLHVRDDGTCQVNGYCKVADGGIATAAESGYRVIARTAEDVVKIIFK